MRLWRITMARHGATAFSGIGSRNAGGRWTPPGRLAVYTAEHTSTAILEMLVHMDPAHFGRNFVLIAADLPDDLSIDVVTEADLPSDWRTRYEDDELQQVGADWLDRAQSVGLVVPSAVAPAESNIILNPEHPEFAAVTIHDPEPYLFDPRLLD